MWLSPITQCSLRARVPRSLRARCVCRVTAACTNMRVRGGAWGSLGSIIAACSFKSDFICLVYNLQFNFIYFKFILVMALYVLILTLFFSAFVYFSSKCFRLFLFFLYPPQLSQEPGAHHVEILKQSSVKETPTYSDLASPFLTLLLAKLASTCLVQGPIMALGSICKSCFSFGPLCRHLQ